MLSLLNVAVAEYQDPPEEEEDGGENAVNEFGLGESLNQTNWVNNGGEPDIIEGYMDNKGEGGIYLDTGGYAQYDEYGERIDMPPCVYRCDVIKWTADMVLGENSSVIWIGRDERWLALNNNCKVVVVPFVDDEPVGVPPSVGEVPPAVGEVVVASCPKSR